MKRKWLFFMFAFLMMATISRGVLAQDATPVADTSLLEGLNYPVIEYTTDGATLAGPTELEAGRYLVKVTSTSPIEDWDLSFYSPTNGMTGDELLTEISTVDTTADEAPDWYFTIGHAGGVSSPGTEAVVQLSEGEWVAAAMFFGETEGSVAAQKVTVSGDLPEYPAIDGAVDVTLADLSIDLPDTIAAGPHLWQVANTGAMPHFVYVMKTSAPLTNEEAVNGVKLFFGMSDATPAADGSAGDPMTWEEISGSSTITNGVTMFEMNLEPGNYIAFCFIEGPGELGSHALHGMTQVFTVV